MDKIDRELLDSMYGKDRVVSDAPEPENTPQSFEEFLEEKKHDKSYEYEPFEGDKIPSPILWEDLDKKSFEEQSWRIKNLVPKQGSVILASISGNRKTWIAMEMAKCIASGENFLGEEKFKTEGANVLYINGENSESEMQRRGRQLGFSEGSSSRKLYLVNTDDVNLNTDEGALWLRAFIEFYKIDVIFVDTFIAIAGALKEDKAEEIRKFFNRFNSLKNAGVVLIWLMHMRKPNNFEGRVPKKEQLLGSQDKTASVEVLLMLQSEAGSEEISVYQRKNRLAIETAPFKIGMKDTVDVNGKKLTILKYEGDIEESENKKDQAKELILEILGGEEKTTNQILELLKKEIGSKNIRSALKELSNEGLVKKKLSGKQNCYFLPKEGDETQQTPHNQGTLSTDPFDFFDSQ